MSKNFLFLTLKIFASTGGIEKVCRIGGKAMYEMGISRGDKVNIYSMYDKQVDADDNKYFPTEMFRGFGRKKITFIYSSLKKGCKSDVVILSHINLLLVGWLIKQCSPSTKIILFAHGIEIWNRLSTGKKLMLNCCDQIISVSNFTSKKLQELHQFPLSKCKVLNNCLDPFLPIGYNTESGGKLRQEYGYTKENKIIFTLSRLSSKERYKGYDKVLNAMVSLRKTYPEIRYLLAGSHDVKEKEHLEKMIASLDLTGHVHLAGFIPDDSLVSYFSMADLYVMPSMKEGFGIVFIEAMYYGVPVIAGNRDGSVDALCNGALGILVDPLNTDEVEIAIETILLNKKEYVPDKELLMEHFSYESYKIRLEQLIR